MGQVLNRESREEEGLSLGEQRRVHQEMLSLGGDPKHFSARRTRLT